MLLCAIAVLGGPGSAAAATGPALSVDGTAGRHPISPDIYGLNFADPAFAHEISLPVDRWGGNTTDTYNWRLKSSNTGSDWYFENLPDCWSAAHGWCAGGPVSGWREFVDGDLAAGADPLITLPMMGRVAKDAKLQHPFTCGFPATVFPAQDSFDPYDPNCGNGLHSGNELTANPNRDGVLAGADFSGDWIEALIQRYGPAAAGGVGLYELGNEPALWSHTHRDMHPAAVTYDELWAKSRNLAATVKAADPDAEVIGFSEWGWPNYFCSGADHVENGCFPSSPDRAAHGGMPLVEWYLNKMRAYEHAHGQRLLDYIDVHYYRQGGTTADVTRSLWDSGYTDPSWINERIRLIPRMRQWVARNYPGTKLALTEYNLSVPGDPTLNALIQADTLGIFAREGVDLATRWAMPHDGDAIDDAFRIFRNFNGHGAKFGGTWVRSTSDDQARLAVYGAARAAGYTILVINKTATDLTSSLNLDHIAATGPAQVYEWAGSGIARQPNRPIAGGGIAATYSARSMTLYVIPAS